MDSSLIKAVVEIAVGAGKVLEHFYERQNLAHSQKADQSPVTEADLAADEYIREALAKLNLGIPVISEEGAPEENLASIGHSTCWIVDPLDGTQGYLNRSRHREYAVSIGLLENLHPILGVISLPAWENTYFGTPTGGAYSQFRNDRPLPIRCAQSGTVTLIVNRSMKIPAKFGEDPLTKGILIERMAAAGKFCKVAAGQASVYVRNGNTCEWDTAAGHAIVEAAGGTVVDFDGNPLRYGKPNFVNQPFLAFAPAAKDWKVILKNLS